VEVVASLSQGRTAAAQCGLFTYKSVPVIFEQPCNYYWRVHAISLLFKISISTRNNFFEITDNLGKGPPTVSPALVYCGTRQWQGKERFKTLQKHLVVNRKRRRSTETVSVTLVSKRTAIRSGGTSDHEAGVPTNTWRLTNRPVNHTDSVV